MMHMETEQLHSQLQNLLEVLFFSLYGRFHPQTTRPVNFQFTTESRLLSVKRFVLSAGLLHYH